MKIMDSPRLLSLNALRVHAKERKVGYLCFVQKNTQPAPSQAMKTSKPLKETLEIILTKTTRQIKIKQ